MSREKNVPCYKCTERHAACHSHCDKYISWKKEHEEIQTRLREDRDLIIKDYYNGRTMIRRRKKQ